MPDVKTITLPTGTTYNIVDQGARDLIAEIESGTGWLGVTTTPLTDGASTNPILINGVSTTAEAGNLTSYGSKEFIFNGTVWQELGDMSMLGELAYKNSASGTFTPYGTVSQPTFTGTQQTITVDTTPAGTVSQPTFTGTEGDIEADFTPAGTVAAPTITVTPTTDTVNSITDVGTLPSLTMTVANENLTIGFSQGTLPTKGSAQTVMTGASATATAPAFTGTAGKATGKFTPEGSVSQPTFTGTSSQGSATLTPSGTVSQPTFTGTSGNVTVE